MTTIGIVGAGPAGMMAALNAARLGAKVMLFDSNLSVGRKLQVTGSGRCNITNQAIHPNKYTCADSESLAKIFDGFGYQELVNFLEDIAIPTFSTLDGWCYPRSESAAAVVDTFATALRLHGIELHLGCKIMDIQIHDGRFNLLSAIDSYQVTRVIVAAGGMARPELGSRGDCYPILRRMGHSIVPVHPALAPILADVKVLHKLQGVRMDVDLQLWRKNKLLAESHGNVIITQWGLNGPAAMDLSHHIDKDSLGDLHLQMNLLTDSEPFLRQLFIRKQKENWPVRTLMQSVLPFKVPPVFMRLAGLSPDISVSSLSNLQKESLFKVLTSFRITVEGTKDFRFAQSSAGGVPITEIEPETMMSRKISNLYLAGETLDVVGPCGGFNLQFAFSSGVLAGKSAAKNEHQ